MGCLKMAAEIPWPHWSYPRREHFEMYPIGIPRFDPFPKASEICHGDCPIKLLHILLSGASPYNYGRDRIGIGELFHKAVIRLKRLLQYNYESVWFGNTIQTERRLLREVRQIIAELTREYEGENLFNSLFSLMRQYIRNQIENGGFDGISSKEILFEVTVVNPRMRIPSAPRPYPILCRIDEINLTDRILIERFSGRNVPNYKFVQAAINFFALSTLSHGNIRSLLGDLNDWRIVIETPYETLDVDINDDIIEVIKRGYYWYRVIFRPHRADPRRGIGYVYDNGLCNPPNYYSDCPFFRTYCFTRRLSFQLGRSIRRRFSERRRLIFYDLVWDYHLYLYKATCDDENLRAETYIEGRVIDVSQQEETNSLRVVIEASLDEANIALKKAKLVKSFIQLIYNPWTFYFGPRINGILSSVERGRNNLYLHINVSREYVHDPEQIRRLEHIRIYRGDEMHESVFVYKEATSHVLKRRQYSLYRLTKMGAESVERYQNRYFLRLLDAIYGGGNLLTRGNIDEKRRLFENRIRQFRQYLVSIRRRERDE